MPSTADRNLLFGILALQMDFISRDALIAAMHAWVLDKAKRLGQILLDQGHLAPERLQLLDALVREHLKAHDNDPQHSLAAVTPSSGVQQVLVRLGDEDLQASLAVIGSARVTNSEATVDGSHTPRGDTAGLRYRILRPHAKGGLGEVSVALDQELHREVALKEIQERHAHDPISRGRFLLEAEVTGRLEHPGIVPVYGLGQYDDGRPFYAMRFVKGDNLKEAIRRFHEADVPGRDPSERSLAFRQLLGRFVDVCHAIAYAHSRGVLHRDLKPGNIMLGKYGETLVVDWGLAKPIDRPEPARTADETTFRPSSGSGLAATQAGAVLGTPAYMSPEQAAGRLDLVGPASDVYSLGATLYALLTGQAPFREGDEEDVLQKVQRGDVVWPRQVKPGTPAALEAICRQAMARKPEERYPTALVLAVEVEHWLADEPVSIYREPLLGRLRRWGRRHRPLVMATAALLVTAVVALAVSTYLIDQQQRATEAARQEAEQERDRAERERDRANANFALARQAVEQTITRVAEDGRLKLADFHRLRRDLLASAVPFYEQFVRQPGADAKLEAERGRAYGRLGDVRLEMGEREQAVAAYEQMRAIFTQLAADFPPVPEYRQDLAASHNGLGLLLRELGKRVEAEAAYRAALDIQERLVEDFPAVPEYHQTLALCRNNLGVLLRELGKRVEAEAAYRAALATRKRLAADFRAVPQYRQDQANSHRDLGLLLSDLGKRVEAEAAYRAALDIQERLAADFLAMPAYRQALAASHNNLGILLRDLGKQVEAEAACRAALDIEERLAADFPAVLDYRQKLAASHNNLGNLLGNLGKRVEAEAAYCAALDIQERLAADSPAVPDYRQDLARSHNNLGILLRDLGKRVEAEATYRAALGIQERLAADFPAVPDYRQDLARSHNNLGVLLRDLGKRVEAEAAYHSALDIQEHLTADFPAVPAYRQELAITLCNLACLYSLLSAAAGKDASLPQADRDALAERHAAHAVTLLAKAQAAGYFKERANVDHLKKAPDLDPLRSRPDFQKLLRELEQKAEPPAQ